MAVRERLQSDTTCAVVVDVQERLYRTMLDAQTLEERITRLIRGLRLLDVPLLATEQYPKGLGPTLESVKGAIGDSDSGPAFAPVEKLCFSCMDSKQFVEQLFSLARKNVVIAGIESHVCVQQTALDLHREGYEPIVVADCVSSRRAFDRDTALEQLRRVGVTVTTSEALLFELCRYAGTDTFKKIAQLVK